MLKSVHYACLYISIYIFAYTLDAIDHRFIDTGLVWKPSSPENMKLLIPFTILIASLTIAAGRDFYSVYYFRLFPSAECTKGYALGGGVPIITAPVAKAQKISIAFLAGKIRAL